jgi:hypothetical protein
MITAPTPRPPSPATSLLLGCRIRRPWKGEANWEGHSPSRIKCPSPEKPKDLVQIIILGEGSGVGGEFDLSLAVAFGIYRSYTTVYGYTICQIYTRRCDVTD